MTASTGLKIGNPRRETRRGFLFSTLGLEIVNVQKPTNFVSN